MAGAPRRRAPEELIQRYKRGVGGGRDIYVEGRNDKWLLDWYLRRKGSDAVVYSVDSVDIPDGLLIALGLNPGSARSRVIALRTLLGKDDINLTQVKFLIDRDQESLSATAALTPDIALTDWGTLELSLAHDAALARLAEVACGGRIDSLSFVDSVYGIASQMYFVRAAAKRLRLPLKMVDPDDFIAVREGRIAFDGGGYLRRVLVASGQVREQDRVAADIERCQLEAIGLNLGRELRANDHDVCAITLRVARQCGGLANRSVDDVRSHLLMNLDFDVLDAQPTLRSLAQDEPA